ncbi:MAG: hypothetical protein RR058_04185 [Oscillospiraceae bacterium]
MYINPYGGRNTIRSNFQRPSENQGPASFFAAIFVLAFILLWVAPAISILLFVLSFAGSVISFFLKKSQSDKSVKDKDTYMSAPSIQSRSLAMSQTSHGYDGHLCDEGQHSEQKDSYADEMRKSEGSRPFEYNPATRQQQPDRMPTKYRVNTRRMSQEDLRKKMDELRDLHRAGIVSDEEYKDIVASYTV